MYIAVSTDCFPEIPMPDVVETFIDLEFTTIEIALRENGGLLSPSRNIPTPIITTRYRANKVKC